MDDFMTYRKKLEKEGLIYPKEEEEVRAWMYKLHKIARNELSRLGVEVEGLRSDGSAQFRPDGLRRLAELSGYSVEESKWYEDSYRVLRLINDRGYDFWAIEKKDVDADGDEAEDGK